MQAFLKERRPMRQNNDHRYYFFFLFWYKKSPFNSNHVHTCIYIHEIVIKLNLVYPTKNSCINKLSCLETGIALQKEQLCKVCRSQLWFLRQKVSILNNKNISFINYLSLYSPLKNDSFYLSQLLPPPIIGWISVLVPLF